MAATCPITSTCPTMTGYGYPSVMDKYAKFDCYSPMNTFPGMPTPTPFGRVAPVMPEMTGYPTTFPNTWTGMCPTTFPNTWTGMYPTTFGYPTTFPNNWTGMCPTTYPSYPNTWTNTWGQPEMFNNKWFNTPYNQNEKLNTVGFRPSSEVELYTLSNPVRILDVEGNRQLYLCFELKGYKPEEVTVTMNKTEKAVIVEAVHDIKESKEHQISRKYSRKFVLPESLSKIDLTKVELKSYLNPEGYLTVEACLPKMTTEEMAKCPTMSQVFNKMPFFGMPMTPFTGYGYPTPTGMTSCYNTVKPVTVKTA